MMTSLPITSIWTIRQLIIFLVISITALTLTVSSLVFAQTPSNSDMQTYENPTLGIKLQYPSDWVAQNFDGDNSARLSATIEPNVIDNLTSLEITKMSGNPNGSSLKQIAENQVASENGKVLQSKPVKLNEKSAYMILYNPDTIDQERAMLVGTFNEPTGNYFLFKFESPDSTYDSYVSAVGNMIKLAQFTNSESTTSISESPQSNASDITGVNSKGITYTAQLDGAEEVPPVDTTATGNVRLEATGEKMNYEIKLAGLTDVLSVRLQLGKVGSNGDVIANLLNRGTEEADGGLRITGSMTSSDLIGPLAGKNLNDFGNAIVNGDIYMNIHTSEHPDGAVRGQFTEISDNSNDSSIIEQSTASTEQPSLEISHTFQASKEKGTPNDMTISAKPSDSEPIQRTTNKSISTTTAVKQPNDESLSPSRNMNNDSSISFITYSNPTWGIEISHPTTWKIIESSDTANTGEIVRLVPPGEENSLFYKVFLAIYDYEAKQGDDLSDVISDSINYYKNDKTYQNFKVLQQSIIADKLGGYPAYSFTATYKEDGVPYKILEKGIKIGKTEYDITYSAQSDRFDKYLPIITKMLDSMTLL